MPRRPPLTVRRGRLVLALSLVLAGVGPAAAVDGVLEIHPACVADGCFPGDDPGFPVVLGQPGSYRLTGNLIVADGSTTAIRVDADDVTIDLNGFAILGPNVCTFDVNPFPTPPTLTCSTGGGGIGISAVSRSGVRVLDGIVRGMGSTGIVLGEGGMIENVVVEQNGAGAAVASGHLHGVEARLNAGHGLAGGSNDVVMTIESSTALRNGQNGFDLQEATLHGSTSHGNLGFGIQCFDCTIEGSSVQFNQEAGVRIAGSGVMRGNVVTRNRGFGLDARSGTVAYAENLIDGNNSGGPQVDGARALEVGVNVCGDDTVCP